MSDMNNMNHVDLERILLKPLTASKVRHTFRGKKSLALLHSWDEIVYRDIGRVFEYKQFEKEWQHITHNETELMRSATALSLSHSRQHHAHAHAHAHAHSHVHAHQQLYYHHPAPAHYPMSRRGNQPHGYHGYEQQGYQQGYQQGQSVYYNSNGCGPPVSGSYSARPQPPPPPAHRYTNGKSVDAGVFEASDLGLTQAQPPQHSQGNMSYNSSSMPSSMSQSLSTEMAESRERQ